MPRLRVAAAVTTGVLLAAGCAATATPQAEPSRSQAPATHSSGTPSCPAGLAEQPLLLVAGEDPFNAGLYRRSACGTRASQIGRGSRYSYVSASGDLVTVTAAQEQVDRVYLLGSGRLVGLKGIGTPTGFTGTATTGGSVAWVEVGAKAGDPFSVRSWRANKAKTLYTSQQNIAGLTVSGAADSLAIAIQEAAGLTLVQLDGSGAERRRRPLAAPGVRGFAGSEAHDLLAVSGPPELPGAILDLAGDATPKPLEPGWRPLSWSPQGRYLLLSKARSLRVYDRTTGIISSLPESALDVYSAAWQNNPDV